MKKFRLLLPAFLLLIGTVVFGQAEKTVSAFNAGTKLTEADIGFLSMVSNADLSASRGKATHEAIIAGTTYQVGHALTAAEAKALQSAIKSFQKTYKAPEASRGAGLCYYWYYYCNSSGYCYYYKYWYYC
jgi:hypothetical protein